MVVGGGEGGRRGRTFTFCSQHHRVVTQVQHCSTCARSKALGTFRVRFFLLGVAPGPPTPHRSWPPAPPDYLQCPKSSNHAMSLFLRCPAPSPSSALLTLLSSRKPPQLQHCSHGPFSLDPQPYFAPAALTSPLMSAFPSKVGALLWCNE